MYIGYKEVQQGQKSIFFLQGAFGGEVQAATGQLLTDNGVQVTEYIGSHPASAPITTRSKEEIVQWIQSIVDGSNKTMQQKPVSPAKQPNGTTAATATAAAPPRKEKEPGGDSDATVSDSDSESDSSSSSSSSSSDEEEDDEDEQAKKEPAKKKSAAAATITTAATNDTPSSTFHFVSYRDEIGGLSDTGDPPRRMWHWLLKDAQGREHVAVETIKWEQSKKRFTYSAMPPFSQVKPMVCYNKRGVIEYLNQFLPPNARHAVPPKRSVKEVTDGAKRKKEPKTKTTPSAAAAAKKAAVQPKTAATPPKNKKSIVESLTKQSKRQYTKHKQLQQQQQQEGLIANIIKRGEARDQKIAELKQRLSTLRTECGMQYSLTLVGLDGAMEVITSNEERATSTLKTLVATAAAAAAGGNVAATDAVNDGLTAANVTTAALTAFTDATTLPEKSKQMEQPSKKQKRQLETTGDGGGEPGSLQNKKSKRNLPADPDVAAVFKSMRDNVKIYLTGKWIRDPLPPHPLQETLETFDVAEDCGEDSDRKTLLDKLTVGFHSVDEAGPGSTADPPKESDILVVLDCLPEPVSGTDVELQPVWGIDSYTRMLLLDALKCCFEGSDEDSRDHFIDLHLLSALNGLGDEGWDIQKALTKVERKSTLTEDVRIAAGRVYRAFEGLEEYFNEGNPVKPEARKHARAHPKGEGVIVTAAGGLAAGTFLGEYVGELYTAWRWAEREVSRRKLSGGSGGAGGSGHTGAGGDGAGAIAARKAATRMGASSEYYNIVLERPKADPRGYDVMYVDAVQKGNFVSRLSHSCNPNCRSVTVAVGGRLTVGVWTTRDVAVGEELTVDFAGETDVEREGNAAVCLCGSAPCRGTFLYVTPGVNSPLNAVVAAKLTMSDRCGMILQAARDATLTFEDNERLRKHGFKELLLSDGLPASSNEINNQGAAENGAAEEENNDTSEHRREQVPVWLKKWLALALQFVEMEAVELQTILTTAAGAAASPGSGGDGNADNNAALSYTEEEIAGEIEHVNAGRVHSLAVALDRAKMFLRHQSDELKATAPLVLLSDEEVSDFLWSGETSVIRRALGALSSYAKQKTSIRAAVGRRGSARRGFAASRQAEEAVAIKEEEDLDDEIDDNIMNATTPAPSSMTERTANEDTVGEVNKNTSNITQLLDKIEEMIDKIEVSTADAARTALRRASAVLLQAGPCHLAMHDVLQMYAGTRNFVYMTQYNVVSPTLANGNEGHKYRQTFLCGLLTNWHRSSDPVDALLADRRGCICLPDVEVCYMPAFADGKYAAPGGDRSTLLRTLWENPRAGWPKNCAANFTFRHNQKVFGSPQLDAVLREDGEVACRGLVENLQAVAK